MYKTDFMKVSFKDRITVYKALKKGNTNIFAPSLLKDFEEKLANKIKAKYSCILPNCTSSIFVAINCLKLKAGDEIIIPNLTHSSSIYPLILSGLKIVTYDFEPNSYDADLTKLEKLITKKTKAIMVCYLHGYPNNVNKIKALCNKNKISLIEDAAQGFGVKINQKFAGTIGNLGCYSFGESKLLRIGEGGALVYNKNYQNEINKIRHVGEIWKSNKQNTIDNLPTYHDLVDIGLDYDGIGFNFRVMPFSFAYANNRLKDIDRVINTRQLKLKIYYDIIKKIKTIKFVGNIKYGIQNTAPFSAWIVLDSKYKIDKIVSACLKKGIPIGKFKYDVVSNMKYFEKHLVNKNNDYQNSIDLKNNSLFLPIYENLSNKDIFNIANTFVDIIDKYNENNEDPLFDTSILKENIKYFNGFFIK